jgi:hypothetical protein
MTRQSKAISLDIAAAYKLAKRAVAFHTALASAAQPAQVLAIH